MTGILTILITQLLGHWRIMIVSFRCMLGDCHCERISFQSCLNTCYNLAAEKAVYHCRPQFAWQMQASQTQWCTGVCHHRCMENILANTMMQMDDCTYSEVKKANRVQKNSDSHNDGSCTMWHSAETRKQFYRLLFRGFDNDSYEPWQRQAMTMMATTMMATKHDDQRHNLVKVIQWC